MRAKLIERVLLTLILAANPAFARDAIKITCRRMGNGVLMPDPGAVQQLALPGRFSIVGAEPVPDRGQWANLLCTTDVPVAR